MSDDKTVYIWNPETRIVDLDVDPVGLASSEIPGIAAVWRDRRERLKDDDSIYEFTEKLAREWAIETGIVENLYDIDRGVTQTLIDRGFQAELLSHGSTNRPREYVLRLLEDQKAALDGVFAFVKDDRSLSTFWIRELHAALLRSQPTTEGVDSLGRSVELELVRGAWKEQSNSPKRDGVTYYYCPPVHVASEMDRLIEMHEQHVLDGVPAEVQTAWLHHRFSQIHPFQDGNGRVARAIASLVLIKNGLFPLVVRRDDRAAYIEALEAADGGDLKPLVDLVARLQRFEFVKAVQISETVQSEQADVRAALTGLLGAADRKATAIEEEYERVFEIASAIEEDLAAYLESIRPEVANAMRRRAQTGDAWVNRTNDNTRHYYRAQIIETARHHLGYFANLQGYRSWVVLAARWERRAHLVFAIHGVGHGFSGSLICAPFLEFRDKNDEDETQTTLAPVATEGFIFFHNDDPEAVLKRFAPWRDRVLQVALRELAENL